MPIHFLSPNPEQKQALDELEKLLALLQTPPNKKLKQNIRFVRNFTHALLITSKKYHPKPKLATNVKLISPQVTHKIHPFQPEAIHESFRQRVSQKLPPPPPAPLAPKPLSFKPKPSAPPQPPTGGLSLKPKLIKEKGLLKFNILEPQMESLDWKIFNDVKSKLKPQIMQKPSILENENFLISEIKKSCQNLKLKYSDSYLQKIHYYLTKYLKGYGKIDPLMNEPKITEITCTSYNDIKVIYNSQSLPTNVSFDTNEELDNFILNLAEKFNKKVSESQPQLEISTPKLKVSAFYNPIMGSRFTIKKH